MPNLDYSRTGPNRYHLGSRPIGRVFNLPGLPVVDDVCGRAPGKAKMLFARQNHTAYRAAVSLVELHQHRVAQRHGEQGVPCYPLPRKMLSSR